MNRILIYLQTNNLQSASWLILNESNHIQQSVDNQDLNGLVVTANDEVFVIVPQQAVLLTQVTLPKLSQARLLQALPFALEEKLIADVDTLHFAMGKRADDGSLPVAVVAKDKIQAWLTFFTEKNIHPQAFIPEIFTLPFTPQHWQVNALQDHVLVRTDNEGGFAVEPNNLDKLLELAVAVNPEKKPIDIIRTNWNAQHLLEYFVPSLESSNDFINLLQGNYQSKPRANKTKKIWVVAGSFLLASLLIAFFSNVISLLILHHRASQINTAIEKIYYRQFPQAKSMVAPRERMEGKLRKLSGAVAQNNFLGLLSFLAKSLSATPGIHILNMEFREQQLVLEVTAANFEQLDNFTKQLRGQGLQVKQQSAIALESQVKATLLIQVAT